MRVDNADVRKVSHQHGWEQLVEHDYFKIVGNLLHPWAYLKYGDINTLRLTPRECSDDWGSELK